MKHNSRLINKWGNPTLATENALFCFEVNNLNELKRKVNADLQNFGWFYVERFYRIRGAGKDWLRELIEFLGENTKAHFVEYETKTKGLRFYVFRKKAIDFQI